MQKLSWEGVFPAMLTPFTSSDEIDLNLFGKNALAQLEAGAEGLILAGSLGEVSTLEQEEKKALLEYAVDLVDGRKPVIMNVAEQSTRTAIRMAQDAERSGASGLMVLPPMRYKADGAETVTWFKTIASNTGLPIMIYNNPVDYKIEVTLGMFEQLGKMPNIQAVKESTRDVTNIVRMRTAFGDRFRILCGVDTLVLEELMLGADGLVGGLVDAFPAETVAIYRLAKAGRYAEALKIYRWFMPLLELDIHAKLVQNIKLAASKTGLCSEFVRAPRLPLEGAERASVLQIIDRALASRPTLPVFEEAGSLAAVN